MKLYSTPRSPFAARVRILIRAKSLPIEIVAPPGGVGSAEFRRISAIGKIPVLDTGTSIIAESEVIQEYLEDRYPQPSLRDAEPETTARIRMLSRLADLYLVPALLPFRALLAGAERAPEAVAAAGDGLARALALVDGYLDRTGPYAVAGRLSLADCALAPLVVYAHHFARTLDADVGWNALATLPRWHEFLRDDPAAAPVLGEIETALRG